MEIVGLDRMDVEWTAKVIINAGHRDGILVYVGKTQRRLGMFIKKVKFRKELMKEGEKT